MNKAIIYREAERLQRKYRTRNPFELLDAMNVEVGYSLEYPKNGLKGFCTCFNRIYYVSINGHLCKEERRVIAGHEAGHIVLHSDLLKTNALKDNNIYKAKNTEEREANIFAADFLLSDEEVLDAIKTCDSNFFTAAQTLCIPAPFFGFKLFSMVDRGYSMNVPIDLNSTFLKSR